MADQTDPNQNQNSAQAQKRILIVEDEAPVLEVYALELTHSGFIVDKAPDAKSAMLLAKANKPDLILLDIMLPGKSGLDFLKELKQDPEYKNVKVVMLTNLDASVVIDEGYELGADAYFVKAQFVPSKISEEVKSLLKS